jgi:REP element-mobilizing transposase RayT
LQHIIARGIERGRIFRDEFDRRDFLERLSELIRETGTRCLAWALMDNHFHLLLKTGRVAVAQVLQRLLTGYAVSYNRRHGRHGHLFQNRYKSILCQEGPYLLELVRYIHLNPVRAGIVSTAEELDHYAFSGHSAVMGRCRNDWQDTGGVLRLFADRVATARRRYRRFVGEGIALGRREELIGGGLVRSSGGWAAVKTMRRDKLFQKSDERILGDGEFVEQVLAHAQEQMERKYRLQREGFDLERVAKRACDLIGITEAEIWAAGKERRRVMARSLLCYWAARELGVSQAEISRKLNISAAAVTFSVARGERIASQAGFSLS